MSNISMTLCNLSIVLMGLALIIYPILMVRFYRYIEGGNKNDRKRTDDEKNRTL